MIEDGTAIGDGLATAVARLTESSAVSKVIILLTDGVNNMGVVDPLSAAEIAKLKKNKGLQCWHRNYRDSAVSSTNPIRNSISKYTG